MKPTEPSFFDVRGRGFPGRAEVDAVLHVLDVRTGVLSNECVPLGQAAGRVLARAIVSSVNIPGFTRAAMDGFAVRAADTRGASADNPRSLDLIGESRPARPFHGTIREGQTVRVATGAPVPTGADAILVVEATQTLDANVSVSGSESRDPRSTIVLALEEVSPGRHVSPIGEDVRLGQNVLPAGRRLRPQDLGLLASIGVGMLEVVRKPRVVILSTGNELLPPGSFPVGYEIVDSNSPMLSALAARDGGEGVKVQRIPDGETVLRDALLDAGKTADLILISGGSSVGSEDFTPRVVAELAELAVHGIAIRPASPTGIAFLGRKGQTIPLFLLPGNPVSCFCAYDLFAGRVLRKLGGLPWELPYRRVSLPLAEQLVSRPGRTDYVRVNVADNQAFPLAKGASNLSSTVIADGFILVKSECESLAAGEMVEVFFYDL